MTKRKYKIGDLIKLKKTSIFFGKEKLNHGMGVIQGTSDDWWVIDNHYDINDYIVSTYDIEELVQPHYVSQSMLMNLGIVTKFSLSRRKK
ncbi:MAG: hypothetical protein WC444_05890 [Candidatus Paceibacterota bacterium]